MSTYDFVGVDVAKDKIDVAFEKDGHFKHNVFSNNSKDHKEFFEWLNRHTSLPWVCMEATGHYSIGIADFLTEHSIRVSVINPFQVKNFAKASLARNKNDLIDSKIITQFGQRMRPRIYQSTPAEQKEIKDLTKLLDMLKAQLIQLTNQLHSTQGTIARKALEKMSQNFEKEIAQLEKEIANLIARNEQLNEQFRLLTSIKGIGKLTAFRVIALMPHINSFSTAKQFAAYIGITPKSHQSGYFVGKTTISRLGDGRLRKSLYMAALVAKNYNKALANFVSRLQMKGKTPKTIICAVMRKLAHIIFGVLKSKQPFNENFACL